MADSKRSLREELEQRMLAAPAKLPTSALGRLGQAAAAALRAGRLARHGRGNGARGADLDALAAIVGPLGNLKGLGMKMGQLMSYLELQLPPELQAAFSVLQTHSPAMPFEVVRHSIEVELGGHAPLLLRHMQETPVAAASIGQVHRAELPDGTRVAVKVQYPGIERAIATDFRSATLGTTFAGLLAPGAGVDAVVDEARRALLDECDYAREAAHQERFAEVYREHPTLSVPSVHRAYCSRRVLTTTWADGLRLEEMLANDLPQRERDRFGAALFEFYVGTLLRHGLYNWDPHPGNYLFTPDGRLVMLDYGSTRELTRDFVSRLSALTAAVQRDVPDALRRALSDIGLVRTGQRYDFETARSLVRSFYGPMLRDETLRIEPREAKPFSFILAEKRKLLELHIPSELLFILRIRFGLMAVLARLGARANWYRLERDFAGG